MKRKIVFCFALMSVAVLNAQNLEPTVEVSRVYEGKLIEVRKPVMEMAVPDTLYKFDLDFDYSVFENPYKGSYEFSPYMVDMHPMSDLRIPSKFCMKAGAGYTLHPVFDLFWTPALKSPFAVNVYATHRSYIGGYRASSLGNPSFKGYDLMSVAGLDFGYDWKKADLDIGLSYYGVAVDDYIKKGECNALNAYFSIGSKSSWHKQFVYDIDVKYTYAADNTGLGIKENNFAVDASFGPHFNANNKMSFDVGVELDALSGAHETTAARLYLIPHYIYEKGRLFVDVGVRISAAMLSEGFRRNQIVYPDVRMELSLIPDAMKMYIKSGGGENLNGYLSLLRRNHHVRLEYAYPQQTLFLPSVDRVSAEFGFLGRISNFFSYNIRAGYANKGYAPLDGALQVSDGVYRPCIGFSSYQKWYAALDWDLNLQAVRFDGQVVYERNWDIALAALFSSPAVSADVELMYNWRKRLSVGADCLFASARSNAAGQQVPWYADLGISAEYLLNRKLSFWIRGGNLLNMEIQRNLFFAEKGVNFTAGICLIF